MWDLIFSVPDHCLSFYFGTKDKMIKSENESNHLKGVVCHYYFP